MILVVKTSRRHTMKQLSSSELNSMSKADEVLKSLSAEERYIRRQREVKPLVEAYFAWVHEQDPATILSESPGMGCGTA